MARLVLEIELPDYFCDDIAEADDPAEEAEVSMQLASASVGVVFACHDGDDPKLIVRPMEGRVVAYKVLP
jgi:hypothetical protein